jgi:hypothetical protein
MTSEQIKREQRANEQIKALRAIGNAIIDSVQAHGALGAPAGTLYATLMTYGCTLEQFNQIMAGLVAAKMLRKQGHLYFSAAPIPLSQAR